MKFGAGDFVAAIADAGCSTSGSREGEGEVVREAGMGEWKRYVTHVIYMQGEGSPEVEREELAAAGVECVRIYGRRSADGVGMMYDGNALGGALEAILGGGRRDGKKGDGLSRRNTLNVSGER